MEKRLQVKDNNLKLEEPGKGGVKEGLILDEDQ